MSSSLIESDYLLIECEVSSCSRKTRVTNSTNRPELRYMASSFSVTAVLMSPSSKRKTSSTINMNSPNSYPLNSWNYSCVPSKTTQPTEDAGFGWSYTLYLSSFLWFPFLPLFLFEVMKGIRNKS